KTSIGVNGLPLFDTMSDEDGFDVVRIVGPESLKFHVASGDGSDPTIFDRQIRALGRDGQTVLHQLHVAVVGLGGTGSAVFEQLVRLGVGTITIVDHQTVEYTNVTRIHGSNISDVGRPKVEVQKAHADQIGLGTDVIALYGNVAELNIAEQLRGCDALFSCTDDHRGRGVLSRIAYRYLIPLFNTGVQVKTCGGLIIGIHGRVVVAGPGLPCLICAQQVISAIAAAEAHSDHARVALAGEGYVPGLGEPAPAIIAYTTAAASLLVAEFLQRLLGLNPAIEHQVVVFDRHKIIHQPMQPQVGCYCTNPAYIGAGDADTFLDITWTL
ncbi:MAG: HesA/MoeB/ThiF family protein, partial [Ilumatobacteraceae bacterium]